MNITTRITVILLLRQSKNQVKV